MARTLFVLLALALFGTARADDPDPRSPLDVFGKPCAHGPLVNKAFIGIYSGRTQLFFGQPIVVDLFAIAPTNNGPYLNPHLRDVTLKLTDEKGNAVPFELDDRGYSGANGSEFNYFRLLPTKAHSVGGFWKTGTYALSATLVNAPTPTRPNRLAGTFASNELKFVVRAADAPRDGAAPEVPNGFGAPRPGVSAYHAWLDAAGRSTKAEGASSWAVHTARVGPVLVPQDRPLTAAEEKQLVADLADKSAGVRARAVRGVPRGASREVLATLLARLDDEYSETAFAFDQIAVYPVRQIAHETLSRLGAEVVPALVTAARGQLYVAHREDIVRTLGRIGHHADAEKWLAELIDGDSNDLQYAAQAAAAQWGAAGSALSRRIVAREKLRKEIRRDALTALGNSGTLKEDAARLRPFLDAKEMDLQCVAVRALLTLKDADSLPAFERIARDAKIDQNTRYPAVDAVLAFAPKEAADKLLLEIVARPDDRLRGFALLRAGERKVPALLPLALDALDDKDWYNRVMADSALRGLANDAAGVGYDAGKPDAKAWRAFWAKK
jgi:HEAT repeat protein